MQRIVNAVPGTEIKRNDTACVLDVTRPASSVPAADVIANIAKAPLDPILGTKVRYQADADPRKVNLGIGAYRTDAGKPYVLRVVRKAEKIIANDDSLNHEYLPQHGLKGFQDAAARLLFGDDHPVVREQRVLTVQSLSGTGSLRIGAEFIREFFPGRKVYVSSPTWGNHKKVLAHARVAVGSYRYWDKNTKGLDIEGMIADIKGAPKGSIFLLHACAHNPTGVDPTDEQWKRVAEAIKAGGHVAYFDTAYQGFATGDLSRDASAIRMFAAEKDIVVFVSQSFAKNLGLYNERIGSFNVVCPSPAVVEAIRSQINLLIRPMYSNPPVHGARIVEVVVNTPELYQEWCDEMKEMSGRITQCRQLLLDELKSLGTPGDWTHITSQIGMFSFTGLSVAQSNAMIDKHHVYMLSNGRISMAGVTTGNVKYIAAAIDDVVRNVKA